MGQRSSGQNKLGGWAISGLGGRCFIAVRRTLNELWIIHGRDAATLKSDGLKGIRPLLMCAEPWDWRQVEKILRSDVWYIVSSRCEYQGNIGTMSIGTVYGWSTQSAQREM